LEKMEASQEIGQWEDLHLEFSRELARSSLEARLREVSEPPEAPCPRCEKASPPSQQAEAGVSPP
jgi:hypothetical protein